jgi:hypothetical protein
MAGGCGLGAEGGPTERRPARIVVAGDPVVVGVGRGRIGPADLSGRLRGMTPWQGVDQAGLKWGLLAGMMALGAVMLLGFGALSCSVTQQIAASGVRTEGTVTGFYKNRGNVYAEVTFEPKKGAPVIFRSFRAGSLEEGDSVPVIYLADRPKRARIDSPLEMWGSVMLLTGSGLLLAVGAGLLFWKFHRATRLPSRRPP